MVKLKIEEHHRLRLTFRKRDTALKYTIYDVFIVRGRQDPDDGLCLGHVERDELLNQGWQASDDDLAYAFDPDRVDALTERFFPTRELAAQALTATWYRVFMNTVVKFGQVMRSRWGAV